MYDFNQFAAGRFARTQPPEWRNTPFAADSRLPRAILRAAGIVLLYLFVLGASLWAISQQGPSASSTHAGAK